MRVFESMKKTYLDNLLVSYWFRYAIVESNRIRLTPGTRMDGLGKTFLFCEDWSLQACSGLDDMLSVDKYLYELPPSRVFGLQYARYKHQCCNACLRETRAIVRLLWLFAQDPEKAAEK
jgi:hypothetical protein